MIEIQNPKQKKTLALKRFGIWDLRPARSCPRPPRLVRPPSASPQANAGRAWLAGELTWQAGLRKSVSYLTCS